jgi:hypothetical protein
LELVYRRCKAERKALGAGLIESGLVSAEDVRKALVHHHTLAISQLADQGGQVTSFTPTRGCNYDPRFVMSTAEALASLLPERLAEHKAQAAAHFQSLPLGESSAFAFVRPSVNSAPLIAEIASDCQLGAKQVLEIARWACTTLEIGQLFDPSLQLTSAVWATQHSVVVWQRGEIGYVAVCRTRPASALLMSALAHRLAEGNTSGMWPPTKVGP